MKYCVYSEDDLIALLGFDASAWRVAPRDWYIGWSDEKREENLHLVVNNARFLILPWVYSKNLASMVLSMVTKRIAEDWQSGTNTNRFYWRHLFRKIGFQDLVTKPRIGNLWGRRRVAE